MHIYFSSKLFSHQVIEPEGVKILKFSSPIFYANIDGLRSSLKSTVSSLYESLKCFLFVLGTLQGKTSSQM